MNRRNFIQISALGAGMGALPGLVQADGANPSMAGGVYYTKEAPGRWEKKAAGHLPLIEVKKDHAETLVEVATSHEMHGYEHYIVKHMLLDKNFRFMAEHMFDPMKDTAPISSFSLGIYQGPLHVLSVCNKHDTWLASVEI